MDMQRYFAAEEIIREYVAANEKVRPNSWLTFNGRAMLGRALLGQALELQSGEDPAAERKFAESAQLLSAGYTGMLARQDKIPADRQPRIGEALERLVQLYTAWDKPAEAARWQKELQRSTGGPVPHGLEDQATQLIKPLTTLSESPN
jgi:hypothetical protein